MPAREPLVPELPLTRADGELRVLRLILRNGVRYQTAVTWNEPTHKLTDPPWLVIVGRIIILTLLFMGLAVAVGAAFGGVRVLLKILFPGKIFDRPGQMDVLQLGLSGKRINSRDFY